MALPDYFVRNVGTAIVLADVTDHAPAAANNLGTRTAQIDLTSVADAAARQSDKIDFGENRAAEWGLAAAIELAATPTAGDTVDFYLAPSNSATAATNLSKSALGIVPGACEGTPSTTVIQTNLAEATDDHYIGRIVVFTSGAAAGEASDITDYTGATGTITVTALTTAPAAADTFVII